MKKFNREICDLEQIVYRYRIMQMQCETLEKYGGEEHYTPKVKEMHKAINKRLEKAREDYKKLKEKLKADETNESHIKV